MRHERGQIPARDAAASDADHDVTHRERDARDRQPQRELGDPSGHIQLQDRSCLHPCSSSVVHWEWGDGKRWHTEPELKVYFR